MSSKISAFCGALFQWQLAGLVCLASVAFADGEARILQMTPAGDVRSDPPISQIVLQFDRPVVPLGRMERESGEIPVEISPSVECQWRWLDQTNLACQLSTLKPLVSGTTYSVVARRAEGKGDVQAFQVPFEGTFTVDRPAVNSTNFVDYLSPGRPRYDLMASVPLTARSVKDHLFFVDDENQRYPVEAEELEHSPYDYEDYTDPDFKPGVWWRISPAADLPANKVFKLKSEAGLASRSGGAVSLKGKKLGTASSFGEFSLVGVECYAAASAGAGGEEEEESGEAIRFSSSDPAALADRAKGCDPLAPISIQFSSPVTTAEFRKAFSLVPNPYPKDMGDAWEQMPQNDELYQPHAEGAVYSVNIPGPLKAGREYTLQLSADGVKDMFGRSLRSGSQVGFRLGERRARIVPPPSFSTLESQVDTSPPLYLTNIQTLEYRYQKLLADGVRTEGVFRLDPFKVKNLSYRFALPAAEILNGGSGILTGTLESPQFTSRQEKEPFFVQRTPFAVHVKMSLFDTVAWVTDLSTGAVVPGAQVEVLRGSVWDLLKGASVLGSARTDGSGIAMLPGLEKLDPQLAHLYQWDRKLPRLIVRVTHGDKIALVPADYDFRVDTAFYPSMQKRSDTLKAWGTTAQGIYRAGDTIQFKLFLRDDSREKLILPPSAQYSLEVTDALGKKVLQSPIRFNNWGTWAGTLPLPASAAVGWYTFTLKSPASNRSWTPMRVLVSDFTPAPFRVSSEPDLQVVKLDQTLTVKTRAAFHAGGAYGGAKGRVTITSLGGVPQFSQPALAEFDFGTGSGGERELLRQEFTLSKSGEHSVAYEAAEKSMTYSRLRIESTVSDERGKNIAGFATVPFWGRDRYVGLRVDSWVFEKGKDASFDLTVVDTQGQQLGDIPVALRIERDQVNMVKAKSAGNAYLPEYQVEQIIVREETVTSTAGSLAVHFVPQEIGNYRVVASVKDSRGNTHESVIERWVVGSGEMVWQINADEQIKVTADKASYAVGDQARFLIQNPFPGSEALITIEREGILSRRTEKLKDSTAVITVPIEPAFAPGFYLSVVIASPRVNAPLEKDVDLGKPAYRVGYARVSVPRSREQILLDVQSDRKMYQPGDDVTLTVSARDFSGNPQRGELAITVLDQAVFDLIKDGKSLYDVYSAFYQLDSLGVINFNLLRQLIGRQSFERKGMSEPGDGGRGAELRSIDSFVAHWNPSVVLDAQGKATVHFKAPANLTGWIVHAVAVDNGARMGTGSGEFAVSKNIEIRPVNPQIARLGDTVQTRFSVMNRSQSDLAADISIKANGGAAGEYLVAGRPIKPGEREIVTLDLKASSLKPIEVEVLARAGADKDGLKVSIPVLPVAATERVMQTVAIDNPEEHVTIKVPGSVGLGEGKMQVSLFPTIVGDLSEPFNYMQSYPYSCWEQRSSKAMMAAWFLKGGNNLPDGYSWSGAEDLVRELFKSAPDFQGENGGMAYFKPSPESIDPYLSAYTGLVFEWMKDLGYQPPATVSEKLHAYLQELLKRDPVEIKFYDQESLYRVRIMAVRVLAGAGLATVDQVQRLLPDAGSLDIFTRSLLLDASSRLGMVDEAKEQFRLIQSQSNQTADAVQFNDSSSSGGYRLLSSAVRGSCMVLDTMIRNRQAGEVSQDWLQKVVRGIVKQKAASDRWHSTQENVFCVNALRTYAGGEGSFKQPLEISAAVESGVFARAKFTRPSDPVQFFQRDILPTEFGIDRKLIVRKSGERRGYATVGLEFPVLRTEGVQSGIEVHREYSVRDGDGWKVIGNTMDLRLGDVVRVDLYLNAPAARTFVVLDDRLPGTFEVINKQLATSSLSEGSDSTQVIPKGSRFSGDQGFRGFGYSFWGFSHREQRKDAVRFYAEYLEPGKYHLAHLVQVVAPGSFTAPPAHSEEMYVPAVYGDSAPATVKVSSERQ